MNRAENSKKLYSIAKKHKTQIVKLRIKLNPTKKHNDTFIFRTHAERASNDIKIVFKTNPA